MTKTSEFSLARTIPLIHEVFDKQELSYADRIAILEIVKTTYLDCAMEPYRSQDD